MMHLEYKKTAYMGSHIHIEPNHASDIPRLRAMVTNNLNIINPAAVFADKMKSGAFDGVPEEKVTAEAEVVNSISDLWDGQYSMNVLMLLSRALQKIADSDVNS
ncbi:MAG: hypothetical protein K6G27_08255 [Lachnospiraceae bacterium]|nr:hypothetical protein [Lachnospiraceae bacterium]